MKKSLDKERVESRRDFISRMAWLVMEIKDSERGSLSDITKLLEYNLMLREGTIEAEALDKLFRYVYENVDGNKAKLILNYLEIYANKKE